MTPPAQHRPGAMPMMTEGSGLHAGQRITLAGAALADADGAIIMLHGRGAGAADIIGLADVVAGPRIACLAPDAAGQVWYPGRFFEPVARNEPDLSSALSVIASLIARLLAHGVPEQRIALLGFSQGACLALESALRYAGRLGAVIGFSGGLIGETVTASGQPRHDGLPVFLGCSEADPHIPVGRVRETDAVLRELGAQAQMRIYPGASHTITPPEIEAARRLLANISGEETIG